MTVTINGRTFHKDFSKAPDNSIILKTDKEEYDKLKANRYKSDEDNHNDEPDVHFYADLDVLRVLSGFFKDLTTLAPPPGCDADTKTIPLRTTPKALWYALVLAYKSLPLSRGGALVVDVLEWPDRETLESIAHLGDFLEMPIIAGCLLGFSGRQSFIEMARPSVLFERVVFAAMTRKCSIKVVAAATMYHDFEDFERKDPASAEWVMEHPVVIKEVMLARREFERSFYSFMRHLLYELGNCPGLFSSPIEGCVASIFHEVIFALGGEGALLLLGFGAQDIVSSINRKTVSTCSTVVFRPLPSVWPPILSTASSAACVIRFSSEYCHCLARQLLILFPTDCTLLRHIRLRCWIPNAPNQHSPFRIDSWAGL